MYNPNPYQPGENSGTVSPTPDEQWASTTDAYIERVTPPSQPYPQQPAILPGPDQYPQQPTVLPGPDYYNQGVVPPVPSGPAPKRRASGAGRAVMLTLLLAVLFGGLLFGAGWQFGRGSVATTPTAPALQSGSAPASTVLPLNGNNIEAVRESVIANVRPTVVQINVLTGGGKGGLASGVIVDKRGYIVTNNHVVSGAQQIEVVLSNGTHYTAQVAGTDPTDDLAVVKINPPANIAVATLGDSSKLRVGQEVLAIGNPLGNTQTVTNGIISALGRVVSEGQGGATIPNAIQTDAPINPGNSGGALVDLQGNLVGIPTLTAIDPEFNTPASGVGFAIPSNRVQFIVPQIIQSGKVTHTGRAVLGVSAASVDQVLAAQNKLAVDQGSLIVAVTAGGPAARAGLRIGDVIVQIDSLPVTDDQALSGILVNKNPGDTAAVKVYRGSQQLTINVILGELQAG